MARARVKAIVTPIPSSVLWNSPAQYWSVVREPGKLQSASRNQSRRVMHLPSPSTPIETAAPAKHEANAHAGRVRRLAERGIPESATMWGQKDPIWSER
jgi:hypothetical protein